MKFVKFTSLENSYRQQFVERCERLDVSEWVSLEKLHGANFNFTVAFDLENEQFNITPGKRTSFLEADENGIYDFYGCTSVVDENSLKSRRVSDYLWARGIINDGETIVIYGELVGKGVQKQVYYGEKAFYAYDIFFPETGKWCDWDDCVEAFKHAEMLYTNELSRGTLTEQLSRDPMFRSTHTPADFDEENIAEGYVVKQLRNEQKLHNGSRAVLKVKNEKFKEKKNKEGKVPRPKLVLTPEQEELHMKFSLYLTSNRLSNVMSKIGTVTGKQFGMVVGKLMQDAKVEFERDERDEVAIDKEIWQVVKNPLTNLANELVRAHWIKILDGQF
ncbi:RNA ligase [Vibrio phage F86]